MRLLKFQLLVFLIVVLGIVIASGGEYGAPNKNLSIAYIDFENNTDEVVILLNIGREEIDLTGYALSSDGGQSFTFHKTVLNCQTPSVKPYDVVRVHSVNCSTFDDPRDYHWSNKDGSCRRACVWNDKGDTARLYDKDSKLLDEYHY